MALRSRLAAVVLCGMVFLAAGASAFAQEGSPASGGSPASRPADRSPRLAQLRAWVIEKTPSAAPALAEALGDADPMARRYAIYALERIGDPAAAGKIAPLLKDRDTWVRRAAIAALGKLGAKEFTPALLAALEDPEPRVRSDTFSALVRIGDPATQGAILKALEGPVLWKGFADGGQRSMVEALRLPMFAGRGDLPILRRLVALTPKPASAPAAGEASPEPYSSVAEAAAEVLALKHGDASGEEVLLKALTSADDYRLQTAAQALGAIRSKKAVPGLDRLLTSEWMNTRRYAVEALVKIGDAPAVGALEKVLQEKDYRLRRMAADGLRAIDGKERTIAPEPPPAVAPKINENNLGAPGNQRPPQFIVLAVDDCANVEGLEALLDICETLKEKGSPAVFTLYLSPMPGSAAGNDIEKRKLLYQRLFDLGCEIAHHTLNHNPGGKWWMSLPREQQVEQIAGATRWYRDVIEGFMRPYSYKGGGGGRGAPIDSNFTRELIAAQNFLYSGSRGQHPDDQGWPTRGPGGRWTIPTGMLDAAAPPVHQTITDGIVSDYPGRFDLPIPAGVAMWKANFAYHYQHPRRPILCVNAFHDWGLRDIVDPLGRPAHATEGRILKQFLLDVLVTNRDKFPDTHCVTFSQVLEYTANGGDLKKALAIGNGQDSRSPVKPSFETPAGR